METPVLHGVFCTSKIPDQVLKKFLASAIAGAESVDVTPNICVLTSADLQSYTASDVSHPDRIDASFESPFHGMDAPGIATLLAEKGTGSQIKPKAFIILDERTSDDSSVLIVYKPAGEGEVETVRTSFEQSLGILVPVDVGTMGMEEVQSWVDADGVYRGSPSKATKGGSAPRKQL